jgi:hypothetical protein
VSQKAYRQSIVSDVEGSFDFAHDAFETRRLQSRLTKQKHEEAKKKGSSFLRFFVFQIRGNPVVAVFKPTFE